LGPLKTLKVSTGDVVKAKVWARFENTTPYTAPVLSVYLNNPANGPQGGGEAARNYSLLGVGVSFSPRGAPAAGQLKAYLRYLFFDQNYQFKLAGSVPLSSTLPGQWQELRLPNDFTAPRTVWSNSTDTQK